MPREELLQELDGIVPKNPKSDWSKYQRKIVDDAIKALEQAPRWIPVSERLPEANRAVLTYIDTGATKTYCLAYWNDVREAWEEWIGYDLIEKDRNYKVLAWMPLPQPCKEEQEKA